MHILDLGDIQLSALGRQIDGLSAGHAERAAGLAQDIDQRQADGRSGGQRGVACEQLERQRLQRVADQYGGRLVEGLVAGRPAAPQIIVIHGGKIVVYQRIHMNQFDRAGRGLDFVFRQSQRSGRRKQQRRPYALAAAQNAVAHRLVQPSGDGGGGGETRIQRPLHPLAPGLELRPEVRRDIGPRGSSRLLDQLRLASAFSIRERAVSAVRPRCLRTRAGRA